MGEEGQNEERCLSQRARWAAGPGDWAGAAKPILQALEVREGSSVQWDSCSLSNRAAPWERWCLVMSLRRCAEQICRAGPAVGAIE